jgi:hypothetical protein
MRKCETRLADHVQNMLWRKHRQVNESREVGTNQESCCYIASLTMSARVKRFSSTRLHALREGAPFPLIDGVAFSNRRLARNRFQARTQSDPCIPSVATAIMITTSNSP